MPLLFSCAVFLSAALLFLVQPLAGKALLPLAGGSPAVWTACMLFFQSAVLAGYALAHGLAKSLSLRPHIAVQVGLLSLACLAAMRHPGNGFAPPGHSPPALWVSLQLALWVGLPVLALSTLSPTLQHWFARAGHAPGARPRNPYALYVASNAGSLLGLLAFPFLVEPSLSQSQQWRWWRIGLGALVLLVIGSGFAAMIGGRTPSESNDLRIGTGSATPVTSSRRLRWLLLAMASSSLLLGTTQYISTDVAAVPLLWIVPLALYLITFIGSFASRPWGSVALWSRVAPLAVLPLVVQLLMAARTPTLVIVALHLAAFAACAMLCHRALAASKPDAAHLTEYYLVMSIGGALGGAFNALLAPAIFDRVLEYPIMLGLAMLARNAHASQETPHQTPSPSGISRAVRFALWACLGLGVAWVCARVGKNLSGSWPSAPAWLPRVVIAGLPAALCAFLLVGKRSTLRFAACITAMLVAGMYLSDTGSLVRQERTFFGVHQVQRFAGGRTHLLHGTTLHGVQIIPTDTTLAPEAIAKARATATTYYHRTGPVGDIAAMLDREHRLNNAAFIGLGAGTMAAYAKPGMAFTFFEIDPAVIEIAQDPACFTFVTDARARGAAVTMLQVDGRLGVASLPDASQDLIVVDAFSSDAVPVHLLTKEAISLYVERLAPGGVLAMHVSSRTFRLAPVLTRGARELGFAVTARYDNIGDFSDEGKLISHWVAIARVSSALGQLASAPTWDRGKDLPEGPLWTDDRSDVLSVLVLPE